MIATQTPNRPALRIALPNKGRLVSETRELFSDAGLGVKTVSDRALTASLGGEFEAIFVRAADIPELVADGAADAGITGLDLMRESGRPVSTLLDLGFGACRLAVAVRDDERLDSVADLAPGCRVATSFPRISSEFFAGAKSSVEIVPISGATEIAPHLGIADVIVDLVSTGSTLKTNGLRELTTILESTAQLIVANERLWSQEKERTLAELVAALGSVTAARGQRYLMANAPRRRLNEVHAVLPGINGPTVIDILNGGDCVAVHAVVPAATVYRTIASLKELGCEGILVTRIERLMA